MAFKNKNKNLIKLLHSRFNQADEDGRGWDEDMDDEDEDELFEDDGFGDPMDTFVTPNRNKRRRNDDDYSMDDDMSYESLDDMEEEEDDDDMSSSKADRKNLAVITLGKKIGKGKSKKM